MILAENKMAKLVALDMDGSTIQYSNPFQSSWRALLECYGFGKVVEANEKKYYRRRGEDSRWATEEAALLAGKSIEKAKSYLFPIPYSPGAEEFLRKTKGKIIRGIITTGLGIVADKIALDFDLDFLYCNRLHTHNGYFVGTIDYAVPLWEKAKALEDVARKFNVPFREICYVGDNENDIPLFRLVGLPIAINPKTQQTAEEARKRGYVIDNFKHKDKHLEDLVLKNV